MAEKTAKSLPVVHKATVHNSPQAHVQNYKDMVVQQEKKRLLYDVRYLQYFQFYNGKG